MRYRKLALLITQIASEHCKPALIDCIYIDLKSINLISITNSNPFCSPSSTWFTCWLTWLFSLGWWIFFQILIVFRSKVFEGTKRNGKRNGVQILRAHFGGLNWLCVSLISGNQKVSVCILLHMYMYGVLVCLLFVCLLHWKKLFTPFSFWLERTCLRNNPPG